ncbi:MAG TPA: hypothetical protein VH420_08980 [Gaiellaceae bacterium]|jgi:hypothetical protein
MLAAAGIRTFLTRKIAAPQLMCDEFIYAGIAKSVALDGHFAYRHEPNPVSFVYPALIAPAWWAHSMETAYGLAKAINVGVMTLAALPFFLWARRLSSPLYALAGTALLLLLPAFDYTAMLMTENAFFPAFVLAAYAIARSLERPSVASQLFTVAAIVVALGVRAQAAALVVVLPTAALLYAALDTGSERTLSRLVRGVKQQWVALGALAGLGAVYWLIRGPGAIPYHEVLQADYSLWDGVRTAIYNLAALTLEMGVFPVSALIVVIGIVVWTPARFTPAKRAFVAVALPTFVWFLLEIGLFSSLFASHFPVERYTFYLGALLLLALVTWLHEGLPRPRLLTAIAALVPVGLVLWFPLSRFIQDSPVYSSFGLYYFFNLVRRLGSSPNHIELLASAGAVLAGLLFVFVPRRLGPIVLALPLAVFFVAVGRSAFISLQTYASFARYETGLGRDSSWIEEEFGRDHPVTFLYSASGTDPFVASQALMQAEFWNRNVDEVVNTGTPELCPLPERAARVDLATGEIRPVGNAGAIASPRVVTNQSVGLAGRVVVRRAPLVAYRTPGVAKLASAYEGVYADGWTGQDAAYTGYVAPPRKRALSVSLSRVPWTGPDVPGHVVLRLGTLVGSGGEPRLGRVLARRTLTLHAGASRVFLFPPPRGPYRVELHVEPTFSPVDFGSADSRQLGALFSVGLAPRAAS